MLNSIYLSVDFVLIDFNDFFASQFIRSTDKIQKLFMCVMEILTLLEILVSSEESGIQPTETASVRVDCIVSNQGSLSTILSIFVEKLLSNTSYNGFVLTKIH
jgi:hypothetical protein